MFYIKNWLTDEIIDTADTMNEGKRKARTQGHDGTHNGKWFAPVAYLANERGECVYNPLFKRS